MTTNNRDAVVFEGKVKEFYQKLGGDQVDFFQLLGLKRSATYKEIEAAYHKFTGYFTPARVAAIGDPETRKLGEFMLNKLHRAYDVLANYDKKAEYEKRGYREHVPEIDEPAEEPEDIAKEIYKKATALHAQKDYDKAMKAIGEAIRLDDKKASYYLLLGLCQSQMPHLKKEAEQTLLKAVEMESWNAEPYAALGMLFYSERLLKRAEGYFRKALEIEKDHALAKKKLEEIAGPQEKGLDMVQKKLKQIVPSLFGKKKK